ncbi:hypothetical protein ACTD5D_39985 [Nocardia takedensis]|uniref:hypothetical protein n=1 Tax=Nocardia takedensis TaxID=259390 RepID=UPI003F758F51
MTEPSQSQDQGIDPIIRARVAQIWGEWIGMDPDQPESEQQEFFDREAARLTQLTEEMVGASAHGFLMDRWLSEHPGESPDHQDAVAMAATAWRSAREKVLATELHEQLSPALQARVSEELGRINADAVARAQQLRADRDPDRWRGAMVEVSELASTIVSRVWGSEGDLEFQELALALIQQRLEDNLPTPTTSADPLREELSLMIDEELRSTSIV